MGKNLVMCAVVLVGALANAQAYTHPSVPLTQDDLAALKANIDAGREPWKTGYAALAGDSHSSLGYTKQGPFATDRLSENPERRDARAMIATALAAFDPRSALELAIQYGADEDETGGLLGNLTMQWAERETETALEWVSTQPDREWHDRLIARVAFILSKSDPHSAACHVAEKMEPGPMQDEAVISVLHKWVMADAEAAARWVEGFTAGALRERALGELACRND